MSKRLMRVLSLIMVLCMFLSVGTPALALGPDVQTKALDGELNDENETGAIEPLDPSHDKSTAVPTMQFSVEDEELGYSVLVEAPLGALPTGTELRVEPRTVESVREAVEEAVERPVILAALEISFWLDEEKIDPAEPVQVFVTAPGLAGVEELTLVQIREDEEPAILEFIPEEDLPFQLNEDEIAFETAFSAEFAVLTVAAPEEPVANEEPEEPVVNEEPEDPEEPEQPEDPEEPGYGDPDLPPDDWDHDIDPGEVRPIGDDIEVPMVKYEVTDPELGYTVTVEALESALPAGTELRVEPVEIEDVRDAVAEAVSGEPNILLALDISFWLDVEVEPTEPVQVVISAPELEGKENLKLVHIPDEADPETVDLLPSEELGFELGANAIAFEASDFSVYAVIGGEVVDDNARLFVHFKQADGSDPSEIVIPVKKSDNQTETVDGEEVNHFEEVLYDPGVGVVPAGKMFRGWTTVENYDASTPTKTIEGVREEIAAMLEAGVTDGQTVTYYPVILNARYVSYLDELGASIKNDLLLFKDDETVTYTVKQPYTPREQDSRFDGWAEVTFNEETGKYEMADPPVLHLNNSTISFTKDSSNLVLKAFVPSGHWLIFKENASGATYTAPQFILSEATTSKPSDPERVGYEFEGWYEPAYDEDGNPQKDESGNVILSTKWEDSDWGKKLTKSVTLYANWTLASSADYTIVIWKQQITGNKYDFDQSIRLSGSPNTNVNTVSIQNNNTNNEVRDDYARIRINNQNVDYRGKMSEEHDFTGFHCARIDQNINIAPEGNTIFNVYYDRNEYTLTFQDYTYTQNSNGDYVYWPGGYYDYYGTYSYYPEGYYSRYVGNNSDEGTYGDGRGPVYYVSNNSNVTYYTKNANGTYTSHTYRAYRYNRSNNRTTVKTITARYEANIADQFPIEGSNGRTYDDGQRWLPINNSTYTQVILSWETMPSQDVTFYMHPGTKRPLKTMNYYVEALPGTTTGTVNYNGKTFVLYNTIKARYNMVTESEDFFGITGFRQWAANPAFSNGVALNDSSNDQTINLYYERKSFPITYWDGIYVDKDENELDETNQGQLHEGDPIYFGLSLEDHANDYTPTRTGYVFEGWYLDDACSIKFKFDENTMPEGGINLYAKWYIIQYRVFLHPNVTQAEDPNFSMGGQATSFTIDYGESISQITGIRDDYEQVGWYMTYDPETGEFDDAWNFDAYVGNDTNITTPYAKTEPTELTTPWATPKEGQETYNKDAASGRFWITRKLDLFCKWRQKLTGSQGIQVFYDAVAGTGDGTGHFADNTTLLYDPVGYYTDTAVAKAQGAPTANSPTQEFKYWVIQKWVVDNAETKEGHYEDVMKDGKLLTVYPGGNFDVLKAYAREEDIEDAQPGDVYYLTYKMYLRAEYGDIEAPTPTHIEWFANNGTGNSYDEKNVEINAAVRIPMPADDYASSPKQATYTSWPTASGDLTYEDHVFLGWARVDEELAPDDQPQLSDADLFLKYVPEDGTFLAQIPAGLLSQDYYLCGFINGRDYGIAGDVANLGEYVFQNGSVTVNFTSDSYVCVKTAENKMFMTQGYQNSLPTTVTLLPNLDNNGGDKLFVPKGEVTFTLRETLGEDGNPSSLTLSYTVAGQAAPSGNVVDLNTRGGDTTDWNIVDFVACDEDHPYHAMYAVWAKVFYIYHTGTGVVEKVIVPETTLATEATGDEGGTEATTTAVPYTVDLASRTSPGFLYGGYYKAYSGVGLQVSGKPGEFDVKNASLDWMTPGDFTTANPTLVVPAFTTDQAQAELSKGSISLTKDATGTPYAGTTKTDDSVTLSFDYAKAYTAANNDADGMHVVPTAGTTYYIKEVPDTKYLQPYFHFTYRKDTDPAKQTLDTAWLISDVDDYLYQQTGFVIIKKDKEALLCSSLTVQNTVGGASVKLLPETIFRAKGVAGGYLSYLEVMRDGTTSNDFGTGIAVLQYWVTPDGLIVTGTSQRTYGALDTKTNAKDNVTLENVVSTVKVFEAQS